MSARAGLLAGIACAALLAPPFVRAAEPGAPEGRPAAHERKAADPAASSSTEGTAPGEPASPSRTAAEPPARRKRVPAGILVRAASRRAQERDAATPAAGDRRRGRAEGTITSVEIDWHAGAADR